MKTSRRKFLKLGFAAGAGWITAGATGCASPLPRRQHLSSANGDLRVAVVGLRTKGRAHIDDLLAHKGVRIVALCDVDSDILASRVSLLKKHGISAVAHVDYRRILEMADVDAVVLATPNHQHTLQTIWACQAGKDVYVEKPVSHDVYESRQIAAAAVKYDRIVQSGTQNRSDVGLVELKEFIEKGDMGRIRLVRGLCYRLRPSIGRVAGPQPIPKSVDYDLWAGPAPLEPIMRKEFHYDWHWNWNTGNGEIGNQGVHELDLGRWFLGEKELPGRVLSIGGRLGYVDDGQTPNTQFVCFDYPSAPFIFEVRGLPLRPGYDSPSYRQIRVGVVVEFESGYFAGGRGGGWLYDTKDKRIRQFKGDGGSGHMQNFLDAVRARSGKSLHAPVREGALSSSLVHMANLAHRAGNSLSTEAIAEQLQMNTVAQEAFGRMAEHLEANKINLKNTRLTLGGWLEWDNSGSRFSSGAGAEQANLLLRRTCRGPFIVPEI